MSYYLIVPAAGRGVRAFEFTAYGLYPKPFVSVGGDTVMGRLLSEAHAAGIEDVCYIVADQEGAETYRRFMNPLQEQPGLHDALKQKDPGALQRMEANTRMSVDFVEQPEPLGFGHAVGLVCPAVADRSDDGYVVALPDDLVWGGPPGIVQVVDTHRLFGGMIVMVEEVDRESAKRFGVVQVSHKLDTPAGFRAGEAFRATAVVEKPSSPVPNIIDGQERYFAVVGRYMLEKQDLEYLYGRNPQKGRELDFTPLFEQAIEGGRLTAVLPQGRFLTVGNAVDAQKASVSYALNGFRQGEREQARHALRAMEEVGILVRDDSGRLTPASGLDD